MLGEILKYLSVYLVSMIKFLIGPPLGFTSRIEFWATVLLTISGMMTSVMIFTYLGEQARKKFLKKFYDLKKGDNKRSFRLIRLWKRYGTFGISFLTPILFSPIGGTLILTTLGSKPKSIIVCMLISAIVWALIFSYLVYFLGYKLGGN